MDSSITFCSENDDNFRIESKEEYWDRLNRSVKDLESGNGVTLTMEELEEYIHKTPL